MDPVAIVLLLILAILALMTHQLGRHGKQIAELKRLMTQPPVSEPKPEPVPVPEPPKSAPLPKIAEETEDSPNPGEEVTTVYSRRDVSDVVGRMKGVDPEGEATLRR